MDSHALEYYKPYSEDSHNHFHAVIPLHESGDICWKEASELAPRLTRGWYELSRLKREDRIDFTKEFWSTKLPYHAEMEGFLSRFFGSLDDIGVFLTQQKYDDPFEPHLVYSLANDSGFFHGEVGSEELEIIALQKVFPDYILPSDYLAFLQIHNGFAKLTDTGIMKIAEMEETYQNFQKMLEKGEPLTTPQKATINPKALIPFYKSFGMPFYQCFWAEWYPNNDVGMGMGNVYYSEMIKTISDCTKLDCRVETMAFETFSDWLMFYLETIE